MSIELATAEPAQTATAAPAAAQARDATHQAVYFDGRTNRKRSVKLSFAAGVDIVEQDTVVDVWSFGDVRRVDGPPGVMRLSCMAALPLARLEIADPATRAVVAEHCKALDAAGLGQVKTGKVVLWSLAAVCSIVSLAWFGIPYVADRLAPYVPMAFEKRIGEMADGQIRTLIGGKECTGAAGQAAFKELVEKLRTAGNLDIALDAHVLSSSMANAFALPGGRIYLLDGLLQKARNPDEIAGILAHELGHVRHRDSMRQMIQTGGTSFLFGLLFGDVTGAGAVIFISRSMLDASYSRDAERGADAFAIETMQNLGRSPVPAGALLFRVTGAQADKSISILSSHPLTEERLETMKKADRKATGPELLTAAQWTALKNICK
jgi:Zn-dependent protease with chaperone function